MEVEVIGVKASVGDKVIIRGKHLGEADRHGEVIEVRGQDGAPPWTIKFDDGHESLCFPGPDCVVEHKDAPAPS